MTSELRTFSVIPATPAWCLVNSPAPRSGSPGVGATATSCPILTRPNKWLAKDWRTDRLLRRLEALLAVADSKSSLIITGNGDVIEPEFGIMAIGSGGPYAQSAARALLDNTDLSAQEIVRKSLSIAGDICIYSNHNLTIEELDNHRE